MNLQEEFIEADRKIDRRSHGCDGCRRHTSTERFNGFCGSHLWLCNKCYKLIVSRGIFAKQEKIE